MDGFTTKELAGALTLAASSGLIAKLLVDLVKAGGLTLTWLYPVLAVVFGVGASFLVLFANVDLITAGYVVPLHMYSFQAATALERVGMAGQIDMLWVDGDHLYESVAADLDTWLPLVKPGGLVCGHDYGRETVQRAVHEHFAPEVVGCDAGSIWYARMP